MYLYKWLLLLIYYYVYVCLANTWCARIVQTLSKLLIDIKLYMVQNDTLLLFDCVLSYTQMLL